MKPQRNEQQTYIRNNGSQKAVEQQTPSASSPTKAKQNTVNQDKKGLWVSLDQPNLLHFLPHHSQ